MAILGRWSALTTALSPSTTWASPNSLFTTESRNDGSTYTWSASTSTLTLPSSDLADGYLLVANFEYEDTSNGRHNPQGRITQASGTGNFVGNASSGYNRDNSEDRSYVRCWAFIDSPSASAEFAFQWRRDTDAPTGGTVRSAFEVIPLYYSNLGVYSSASTACNGSTTPVQLAGFSSVTESDTAAIELVSNVVTMKGDNKRYLCLGGQYWQGIGNARSQRIHGFRVDGSADIETYAYSYARNAANADIGDLFTTIVETATVDRTIDQFVYRGDSVTPFPAFGADVTGNTTGSNPNHAMVILELNDSAEVFKSANASQQAINSAGTRVELNLTTTGGIEFNDSASFVRADDNGMNAEQAMDALCGANIFGGYASSSTARYTGYAEFTIDGSGQSYTMAGDYGRGNQSTTDTYGWSANLLSAVALSADQDIGVNAGKITGGEGGTVAVLNGYAGFWGVNLDTLEAAGGGSPQTISVGLLSETESLLSLTSVAGAVSQSIGLNAESESAISLTASVGTLTQSIGLNSDSESLLSITVDAEAPAINQAIGIQSDAESAVGISVDGSLFQAIGIQSDSESLLSISSDSSTIGTIGLISDAESVLSITPVNSISLAIGLVTDAESALGISTDNSINQSLGLIGEAEQVLTLSIQTAVTQSIGINSESESLLTITVDSNAPPQAEIGILSDSESVLGFSLSAELPQSINLISETETLNSFSSLQSTGVLIGLVSESEQPLGLQINVSGLINTITETESVLIITPPNYDPELFDDATVVDITATIIVLEYIPTIVLKDLSYGVQAIDATPTQIAQDVTSQIAVLDLDEY